jgi:hypothetical protein
MSSFDDLMRKQAEMATLAARMAGETDAAKTQEITAALQRESQELQRIARAFEQEQEAKYGIAIAPEQPRIDAQTLATVEQLLAQIEQLSPAAAEAVGKLKADPNFLGGILTKK